MSGQDGRIHFPAGFPSPGALWLGCLPRQKPASRPTNRILTQTRAASRASTLTTNVSEASVLPAVLASLVQPLARLDFSVIPSSRSAHEFQNRRRRYPRRRH